MEFLQTIIGVLIYEPGSISIPLFLLSGLLLAAGVAVKTRSRAWHLSFLEHTPLNLIEKNHPHLPSPRWIVTIVLCAATLLLAGLQTLKDTFPFNDPYQGLNLASLFMLGAAIGIMAELKWKGAKEYASAILSGTALAFLLLIMQFNTPTKGIGEKIFLLVLLVPSILLVGHTHAAGKRRGALLTVLLAFSFWILIYLVQ